MLSTLRPIHKAGLGRYAGEREQHVKAELLQLFVLLLRKGRWECLAFARRGQKKAPRDSDGLD